MSTNLTDRYGNPVPEWYQGYFNKLKDKNFLTVLIENQTSTPRFMRSLPPATLDYRYAEGKWTPKEILLHVIDSERVFAYRALRFSRNDATELAGFEENEYVSNANASDRTLDSLMDEYSAVRAATIALFRNFTEEMFSRSGTANNYRFSTELVGIIIAGHELHHLGIITERYI